MALGMDRFRRYAAPQALLVLATFLLSMAPRRAWANNDPPPPETASGAGAQAAAAATVQAEMQAGAAATASAETETEQPKPPAAPGAVDLEPGKLHPPGMAGSGTVMSLPTGENKTGVSSTAISAPKGPGTIQGMGESFSAQPSTGISTFSVPFALPKARGGAQPSLSLGYSSSSGSGVAGVGWDVSVPFISRQTDRGTPSYNDQPSFHANQDRFVYNGGQELVPVASPLDGELLPTWPGTWQYFRPRVEGSYLRFFWNRDQQLWRVQDKSGVVLELGGSENALETDPQDSSRVFRWNLQRQVDPRGNEVRYLYLKEAGTSYLQDIYDTSPAQGDASNLAAWAHHTRLVYEPRPDPSTGFNRGWRVLKAQRLARVDVTSVRDATTSTRQLLRRYHLTYDGSYHPSLLESIQVEGRCEQHVFEQNDGKLPSTSCPKLPAMKFGYSHVGEPHSDAFEPFNTTLRKVASSPKHSVDEEYTDLYDINSDGLPDVVAMMPGLYNGKHGLWFNSQGGKVDSFGAQTTIGVKGVLGANESVITKHNPNIAVLDLNADATIDLVHMPKVKTYSVYTPKELSNQWWWVGRTVNTSDQLDARVDLGTDAAELRVFDVNGDGLVDVVKSGGTSWQVYFALGRYPGGDGLFGSAQWTGPETAALSMAPVQRCVPWSSTPVRFSDSDTKLGDMNGDGLTDIVRVRLGDIKYWPGRGDGTFGTGPLGCAGGTFSQNSYVQMTSSPQFSDPNGSALHVDDVNGDGLADLVQVRFDEVDVWLNYDGASWTQRRILDNTPPSPSFQNRVRIVDFNGSGTRDILWADASNYKYIDLAGGERPWLLTRIENGLGKSTDVDYTTSTEQMLVAAASGKEWSRVAPMPLHMVSSVTVRDNLGTVGRPDGVYVTRYTYKDPVYDGLQREFRGFSKTTVETVGDANSPTSISETSFELGERPAKGECGAIDYTDPANAWRDNPREALKGLADISETRDAQGVYLSTNHASYTLRKLYSGLDGRGVYVAFENRSDAWLYDTGNFFAVQGSAGGIPELTSEVCSSTSTEVPLRGASVHTRQESVVDWFGNRVLQTAYGADGDQVIVTSTTASRVGASSHVLGEGNWAFRTIQSSIQQGEGGSPRKVTTTEYDLFGEPKKTSVVLSEAGSLARTGPPDGGAPAPDEGVGNGTYTVSETFYDAFGNVAHEVAAGNRCRSVVYDSQYGILPVAEINWKGPLRDLAVDEQEQRLCGDNEDLKTSAQYDFGLQAVTQIEGPNGDISEVNYDGFGRMRWMLKPPVGGSTDGGAPQPSFLVEYHLPDETGRKVSLLVSKTQDGASSYDAEYHETYAYVDGLGRTVVTLSEADPTQDGFAWIAEGLTDYDLKGAARRKYLAWPYDGPPANYDLSKPTTTAYGQQRYDAFGRAVETIGLDGTITLRTKYHALSAEAWDAEDIGPGVHQGTYASEAKDGHGRVAVTTERVRLATGAIEARNVRFAYHATGEVTSITRDRSQCVKVNDCTAPADAVVRNIGYDSLGRMKSNEDPNTGTWKYVYNAAGDLVGTSDARGCGANYAYDNVGRLISEDYSPCEDHHEPYVADDPEVIYLYDEPGSGGLNYSIGRLVEVQDRGARTKTRYDIRGRVSEVKRSVNNPDGSPNEQWFSKPAEYDAADRPTLEWTGATVVPTSVTTSYTRRGAVDKVKTGDKELVSSVKRDADGLVTEIKYGDASETTTGFDYDDLRRLRNLTTFRAQATDKMLLQDEQYIYDRVGNPVEIRDWRSENEWDPGSKPVSRKMVYDDLYRLTRIDYQYHPTGSDVWVDPYAAELSDNTRPQPAPHGIPSTGKRVMKQSWSYDWLGNTATSTDDANLFYDRSLGTITNTGYRLTSASDQSLTATYDAAGYMSSMTVERAGNCAPANQCSIQVYQYKWDEVGRLVDATRQDPSGPGAHLKYGYDSSDNRVRKTVVSNGDERHTIYVFGSLELRLAESTATGYTVDDSTEVPYLFGHGVRLARVTYTDAADFQTDRRRIFLELGDHLGSTSVVLDHATGELVERSTAFAYGSAESNYRTQRWEHFREDYRFTGKEDDIEVGLIYFGARYLNPQLGRWISADPLAVHAPGEADLNLYAYVHGKVLSAVDPVGLTDGTSESGVMNMPLDYLYLKPPPNQSIPAPGAEITTADTPTGGTGGAYNGPLETSGAHGNPGGQAGPAAEPPEGGGFIVQAGSGFVPGAAEFQDWQTMNDPNEPTWARGVCAVSLGVSIPTLGRSPNAAPFVRALRGAERDVVAASRTAKVASKVEDIARPLSNQAKEEIRAAARLTWEARMGQSAADMGLQIHHRIPLEYSHVLPKADPNRAANLVGVAPEIHGDISAMWNSFRDALGGRTPTPAEVMGQASVIDQMFAPEMTFLR